MKKIIIILFSFILILCGCTSSSLYSEEDLTNSGYVIDENGYYEYIIDDQGSVFVFIDGDGNQVAIGAEVYPTSYQTLQLAYVFETGEWNVSYNQDDKGIPPQDAYAYINEVYPEVAMELNKLAEIGDIDTSALEGGQRVTVDKVLNDILYITNVKLEEVTGTSEDYLEVVFDVTNNSGDAIVLAEWEREICYTLPDDEDCKHLTPLNDSEKNIDPNSTMKVEMKATDVPAEAYDFHVTFSIPNEGVSIQSDVANI